MINKPIFQNNNHLFSVKGSSNSKPQIAIPKSRGFMSKKSSEDGRIIFKTKRNPSIKKVRRFSQDNIDSNKALEGHRKNTNSLKLDQDGLKRMLMERMHKRYISMKDSVDPKAAEKVETYAKTQRHFRKSSKKVLTNRSIGSKKKYWRKRRSM